jgi:hypothetical protein
MVDSGNLYDLPLYKGINQKPQREMIIQLLVWLWYGVGLPCLVVSFCAFIFKWFQMDDVKSFVTIMVAVITGLTKAIILWAEKGDVVWGKIKRTFSKKQRRKIR